MVVAKTDRAHRALAAQFADHGRTGPLRARLSGLRLGRARSGRSGTIDAPARPPSHRRATSRRSAPAAARRSRIGSCWRRYAGTDGKPVASLLACRLETGRTHQIRVHLAHIGHPLLGDDIYGPGFKTKAALLPANGRGPRWRPLADRPCMLIYWASSTPKPAKFWSSKSRTAGRSGAFTDQPLAGATERRPLG